MTYCLAGREIAIEICAVQFLRHAVSSLTPNALSPFGRRSGKAFPNGQRAKNATALPPRGMPSCRHAVGLRIKENLAMKPGVSAAGSGFHGIFSVAQRLMGWLKIPVAGEQQPLPIFYAGTSLGRKLMIRPSEA